MIHDLWIDDQVFCQHTTVTMAWYVGFESIEINAYRQIRYFFLSIKCVFHLRCIGVHITLHTVIKVEVRCWCQLAKNVAHCTHVV